MLANLDRSRIALVMSETLVLKAKVKWAVYCKDEMKLNPSISEIQSELEYLKNGMHGTLHLLMLMVSLSSFSAMMVTVKLPIVG